MPQEGENNATGTPLLEVKDVSLRFGGVQALAKVNLTLSEGDICGLIGPNGAGKTSLFNCITRLYNLNAGSVRFAGELIDRLQPRAIIAAGIARTFQNLGLYPQLSVLENVMLGGHHLCGQSTWSTLLAPGSTQRADKALRERCHEILVDLNLAQYAELPASSLAYPTQKRVEIARALASSPKLLLLDEPAGGLTHSEVAEFGDLIRRLADAHRLTVLLVEHHMGLVMSLCKRISVMHLGANLATGTPSAIQSNPQVIAAYLGRAA